MRVEFMYKNKNHTAKNLKKSALSQVTNPIFKVISVLTVLILSFSLNAAPHPLKTQSNYSKSDKTPELSIKRPKSNKATKYFTLKFYGDSPQDIRSQVESARSRILSGEHARVKQDLKYEKCGPLSKKHIKMGPLKIIEETNMDEGKERATYRGNLYYSHNNCFEKRS